MSWLTRTLPPLAARIADGRPVLAQHQVTELTKRVMDMTSADTVEVWVSHVARVVTRMANNQVLAGEDGDELRISVRTSFGGRIGVAARTNQLDESVLRAMVQQCEAIARENVGVDEPARPPTRQVADVLIPVKLWHDETVRAMTATRGTVVPQLLDAVKREQLNAAGFLGFMARSEATITKEGISAYNEETDSEVTITARTTDGRSSGWGGSAARDWSTVDYVAAASHATDIAKRGRDPVALEPGRRTAILGPAAVVQIMRFLGAEFAAGATDFGETAFSKRPSGNKLGLRVFDSRITMQSDPADPDGGYCPYFGAGFGTPAMTWVENGVLKDLSYDVNYAMAKGKTYSAPPYSLRLAGGPTSIDEMIAQCREGIYVNRFSGVEMVDLRSGLTTGVTRDGCLLIKNGKIERGVKNFRFMDSPFFFLNNIVALGPTQRAPFGYTPPSPRWEGPNDWPRLPIIVPPMMVRDFNFSALSDAV